MKYTKEDIRLAFQAGIDFAEEDSIKRHFIGQKYFHLDKEKYLQSLNEPENVAVENEHKLIGSLNCKCISLKGYKTPETGHPVFEDDKYYVMLERENSNELTKISYYKESLKQYVDFIK